MDTRRFDSGYHKIDTYRRRVSPSILWSATANDDEKALLAADTCGELLEADTETSMGLLKEYSG